MSICSTDKGAKEKNVQYNLQKFRLVAIWAGAYENTLSTINTQMLGKLWQKHVDKLLSRKEGGGKEGEREEEREERNRKKKGNLISQKKRKIWKPEG